MTNKTIEQLNTNIEQLLKQKDKPLTVPEAAEVCKNFQIIFISVNIL